jgi:uncharacterized protein with HEPN domain
MAPEDRAALRIHHMRDAIAGIRAVLATGAPAEIEADWIRIRAPERGFEILSEASRHIPEALKATEPTLPWREIAGIGNVLRHDYDGVAVRVLLATALGDFAALDAALVRIWAGLPSL